MDTRLIEYILEIHNEKSITRAAEKLFLTQPALNQQLSKLEKELGTRLFVRTKGNIHATEAGQIYIEYGKKILHLKREAYRIIGDISEKKAGQICIGLTPGRGLDMFTEIYPQFRSSYPNFTVNPTEASATNIQKLLADETLDLGLITCSKTLFSTLSYIPVKKEDFYLVIPSSHRASALASPYRTLPEYIDLSLFHNDYFSIINKESTQRPIIEELFNGVGYHPNILLETASCTTQLSMVEHGLCCAILPAYYLTNYDSERVTVFRLPQNPQWNIFLCYKKDRFINSAENCIIRSTIQYFADKRMPWETSAPL